MAGEAPLHLLVDGKEVEARPGATILEACDSVACYLPRLCYYPGLRRSSAGSSPGEAEDHAACGLCAVRLRDGAVALACATLAGPGMEVRTDDEGLRRLRLDRLAALLARHPHICLTCPDKGGCTQDDCTYGVLPEARCCSLLGRCEFGRLIAGVDPFSEVPRRAATASRASETEGRIRREPGLCVGCGRCARACAELGDKAGVLRMERLEGVAQSAAARAPAWVAVPNNGTMRGSGCTFCGRCVMVCPAGALTAPGEAGAAWLAGRRERSSLPPPVLPPEPRARFEAARVERVSAGPGVFRLLDARGDVIRIRGVPNLRQGLLQALSDAVPREAAYFQVESAQMYTQRESELLAVYAQREGHLPPGNDLSDDLYDDF